MPKRSLNRRAARGTFWRNLLATQARSIERRAKERSKRPSTHQTVVTPGLRDMLDAWDSYQAAAQSDYEAQERARRAPHSSRRSEQRWNAVLNDLIPADIDTQE